MHRNNTIRIPQHIADTKSNNRPSALFLNFLTADDTSVCNGKQYIASKQLEDVQVFEIKGTFESDWHLEVLSPNCFWLAFQFIGYSSRDAMAHTALPGNEYRGFYSLADLHKIQIKAGKTWMVLLGVKLPYTTSFVSEWPLLVRPTTADQPYFSAINIGYRIKQIFEKIEQLHSTPYSLYSKIHHHLCLLIDSYHQDLKDKERAQHKEDIVIYHEAIDYISAHYMDEDINIDTIAEHINVSSRKVYRAFQDKHMTVHKAIQTIRLHKGREMLRKTDMAVDGIAFQLNFSTAHYFYRQFVQCFGHSPSRERELYRKSKKKKKR